MEEHDLEMLCEKLKSMENKYKIHTSGTTLYPYKRRKYKTGIRPNGYENKDRGETSSERLIAAAVEDIVLPAYEGTWYVLSYAEKGCHYVVKGY